MKIAAALGVWLFWGWKIINHGGWFTQVKGRTWQKKRSSLYRSCLHERVILPDYRITLLLQFIHHFCITFTSFLQLIRHFYVSSILCAICTSDPLPERAENGFSGCAGNASRPRNKFVPVHRFRVGRMPETGLTPAELREFPRYALARILMHAVKTEPARFWRVFGWFVACFTGFLPETPWGRFRGARKKGLW